MTTKKLQLRAIDLMPDLATRGPEGVPFRWLESLVEKVKAAVPDTEEVSCKVHNAQSLVFGYEHVLTPAEQLQEDLDVLKGKAAQILVMLPRDGESMTAEQVKLLRKLIEA